MLSDKPIENAGQDELGTAAFVNRLLKPLLSWPSDDSLVLALYAPWGQGKSSALNLLTSALTENRDRSLPRAICVRFNPWLYGDAESLLVSFFGALTAAVRRAKFLSRGDRKEVQKALELIGNPTIIALLATHPHLATGAKILSLLRSLLVRPRNLLDEKKKAAKVLLKLRTRSIPARVVIIMDDLDRLDDEEVRVTMKLVKLLADLPNMSYVLAMDHDRVAQVLAGERGQEYGRAFLEKIVQIPVYLPPVMSDRLRDLVEQGLAEIVPSLNRKTNSPREWWSNFSDPLDYEGILGRRIRTLRDRARFLNNLRFLVASSEQILEVNTHDLVLISFLQTFFPTTYERVKRSKEVLTGDLPLQQLVQANTMTPDQRQSLQEKRVNKILTGVADVDTADKLRSALGAVGLDEDDYQSAKRAVEQLFPIGTSGLQPTSLQAAEDRRQHRIRSPEYFDRYFQLQPPPNEPSDEEVDAYIAQLTAQATSAIQSRSAETPDSGSPSFLDKSTGAASRPFVRKLRDRIGTIDPRLAPALARGIVLSDRTIAEDDLFYIVTDLAARTSASPLRGVQSISSDARAELTLNTVAEAVRNVPNPALAVLLAASFSKRERAEFALSDDARRSIAEVGAERIESYVGTGSDLFAEFGMPQGSEVIWRWRDLLVVIGADNSRISSYLHDLLKNHPERLPNVLSLAAGWSASVPSFAHQPPRDILSSLDSIFGSEELRQLSLKFNSGKYESADEFNLVQQYLELSQLPGNPSGSTAA